MFEKASRLKLRFMSSRGAVTTEDLWDIPLQSRNGFDLDSMAKVVNAELKADSEESFVSTRVSPARTENELRLEILKRVIAFKLEAQEKAKKAVERRAERERLMAILAEKNEAGLRELSVEDIRKRIAELEDA